MANTRLEKLGTERASGRDIYLFAPPDADEIARLTPPSTHFICVLMWDPDDATPGAIAPIAAHLIDAGAVYFCTWGRSCEDVHDGIDRIAWEREMPGPDDVIMTTWHASESFRETAWFGINTAYPTPGFEQGCSSIVFVVVASASRASALRSLLQDPTFL